MKILYGYILDDSIWLYYISPVKFARSSGAADKFDSASEEDCATVFVIAAVDDSALIYGDLSAGRTQEG